VKTKDSFPIRRDYMPDTTVKTLDGGGAVLSEGALAGLASTLAGELMVPGTDGYDEARTLWNAMADRRPGLIVECANTSDVVRCVRFAREHSLLVSVGGAGHNIAGNAACDDGFMISLRKMKSVQVDADGKRASVEPGVTLGELDAATQAYGLATPTGINSTTGIAGLTLGGGFGWLSRKHGLTADNLVSAEMVTAKGDVITVGAGENPDLYWGIRGGGGNFGIVTSFEFRLHPVGPEVLSGMVVYPYSEATAVLRHYRDFVKNAPDEVTVWVVMRKAPPLPFLPEEVHGTEVVILAALYAGDMAEGEKALQPLRDYGSPIADVISPHPFTGFQAAFDPLLTPGERNYWKSHDFLSLSDGLLDAALPYVGSLPSDSCEIFFAHMGGATSRVPADATAYRHREAQFIMNVHGRWHDAGDDEKCVAWCRDLFDATTPFATGGVYVNFMTEEEMDRVESAYGESYKKLVALKDRYDPENLFRFNQNVKPSS
jgi:FAD/FMN-containing dehydrogenase